MNASDANRECRHHLLARTGRHQISHCTCGTVHVTVANTTLRLSRREFAALAASIRAADRSLEPPAETEPEDQRGAVLH